MPEFDVVVLVPIKMRVSAETVEGARTHGPAMVGAQVLKRFNIEGVLTLASIHPVAEPASAWDEARIDVIGQNGNDGAHY